MSDGMTDEATPYWELRRNEDPSTSHQAAHEIGPHIPALNKWVRQCVTSHPGSTANELAVIFHQSDTRRIGRRLDGCEKAGLIIRGDKRRCRETGRMALTWFPAPTWVEPEEPAVAPTSDEPSPLLPFAEPAPVYRT